MREFLIVGGLALAGCTLSGTAADGAGAASGILEPEGAIKSTSEALSWISGPFVWNQGDPVLPMQLVSTSICVLARVQGRFGGGGESVSVTEDGNFWYLGGSSQQAGVGGAAYCYARSLIVPTTGGGTSGEFMSVESGTENNRCFGPIGVDTWWGDAATMISGIQGRMDGNGESVFVTQSANAFAPSKFSAETCSPAPMWGFAHAFFFGPASSGRLVTFVGPTGTLGKVDQIVEKSASGSAGYVVLAPSGQSLCYFTKITGGFFGGGEWAEMSRAHIGSLDYWVLRTGQGTSSANVIASARCISRNQQ